MVVVKPKRKRRSKVQKNPLRPILLALVMLAIVSGIIAYFMLDEDEEKQVAPAQTTTEQQPEEEEPVLAVEPMYTGTWVSNYDGAILTTDNSPFTAAF